MSLHIQVKTQDSGVAVLHLDGRLDALTAPDLKQAQREWVEQGFHSLIVDLAQVPFIDSSGLAALVSGLRLTRESGGTLKLAALGEDPGTVFKLTRLDRVFEMYPDVSAALDSLPAG